ncbi:hypothetical protein E1301_Tti006393 [Triplophysa tibetana]|uniref:Uncharacterized protein n=1 Tax=Triplophysa tibetana TaxID=1572043 RepID=A0A5A9P243_9TELE|nr:hypothetical protein E1301_Tti006393 [Triplophysa tibetana]
MGTEVPVTVSWWSNGGGGGSLCPGGCEAAGNSQDNRCEEELTVAGPQILFKGSRTGNGGMGVRLPHTLNFHGEFLGCPRSHGACQHQRHNGHRGALQGKR